VGDLHGTPLARLAKLLGVEGLPPEDYGWTEVIEAVQRMVDDQSAILQVTEDARRRPCAVYDHALGGPCPHKPKVQGVCEGHAVMCAMCGKGLSVQGICPACLKVLAKEQTPTTGPLPSLGQPILPLDASELAPTPGPAPRRSRRAESF